MSIGLIVTRGFGNGALAGNIAHLVTMGFDIAEPPAPPAIVINYKNLISIGRESNATTVNRKANTISIERKNNILNVN